MVTLRYLFADLVRRRYWTLASLLCFVVTSTSQTCLALIGVALSFNFDLLSGISPTGIQFVFSRLLVFLTLISVATSAAIFVGMSLSQIVGRKRDAAIMKAIGLAGEVNTFFLGEEFLVSGAGVLLGTISGLIIYEILGVTIGPSFGSLPQPSPLLVIIIALILFFAFMTSSTSLLWILGRLSVVTVFSEQALTKRLRTGALVRRLRLATRFALRDILSRRSESLVAFSLATLSFTLLSVLLFGGSTSLSTAGAYIQRGVGEHVYLIATPTIAEGYLARLSLTPATGNLDYLNSSNTIPITFLEQLRKQQSLIVDSRLIAETKAIEMALVKALPGPSYEIIGDERSSNVLVVGVQSGETVADWVTSGEGPSNMGENKVAIGDGLQSMFSDWSVERVALWGKAFPITGVVVDPLNLGKTVYLTYDSMRTILGLNGPNIVFIKLKDSLQNVPDTIKNEAAQYGLTIVGLDETVNAALLGLDNMWYRYLGLLALVWLQRWLA